LFKLHESFFPEKPYFMKQATKQSGGEGGDGTISSTSTVLTDSQMEEMRRNTCSTPNHTDTTAFMPKMEHNGRFYENKSRRTVVPWFTGKILNHVMNRRMVQNFFFEPYDKHSPAI
jgi:hypothetical protein